MAGIYLDRVNIHCTTFIPCRRRFASAAASSLISSTAGFLFYISPSLEHQPGLFFFVFISVCHLMVLVTNESSARLLLLLLLSQLLAQGGDLRSRTYTSTNCSRRRRCQNDSDKDFPYFVFLHSSSGTSKYSTSAL